MPVTKLHTGFNIEVEFTISAFHKRLLAWFIDLIVILAYTWLVNKFVDTFKAGPFDSSLGWLDILVWIPVLLYFLIAEVTMNGQSPGKRLMRIKVITATGGQPTLSQFLIRWLFRSVDFPLMVFFSLIYSIWPWYLFPLLFTGLISIILTPLSQRIGDLLAGTIVIDTNTESAWQHTVFTEVEENYQAVFPGVMKLSDRDMNTIKQVLIYTQKKPGDQVVERVADKIKMALKIETDLSAKTFLETLLKDYNYLSRR
jgi:uncharacterized RDD family membrane protein YckC